MVECVLAKDETGVRFSLPAQKQKAKHESVWPSVVFVAGRENRKTEAAKPSSASSWRRGRVRGGST